MVGPHPDLICDEGTGIACLGEDTFVLESSDSFRLRFDRDAGGGVFRITGLYLDDENDQTLKNPD